MANNKHQNKTLPQYKVILLNDDIHSFEHVIKALCDVFPEITTQQSAQIAQNVHEYGKCILVQTHLELAETYEAWLKKFDLVVELEKV